MTYVFIYSLLIQGCMSSHVITPEINKSIERWIDEKDYAKALSVINVLDESDPGYEGALLKKERILVLVSEYEEDVLYAMNKDINSKNIESALVRINVALKYVPESKRLNEALSSLLRPQNIKISKAELKVLMAKSEWLEKSLAYFKELQKIDPQNTHTTIALNRSEKEVQILSMELIKHAEIALEDKNLLKANKISVLALRLDKSENAKRTRNKIKNLLKKKKITLNSKVLLEETNKISVLEKEMMGLIEKFDEAFLTSKFVDARVYLVSMMNIDSTRSEVVSRRDSFRKGIEAYIEKEIKVGYSHYKRDQYNLALGIWENILKLNPVHKQANEYIVRVKKVLKKLDDLELKRLKRQGI